MQIVIDIPEDKYKRIVEMYDTFTAEIKEWGLEAIKNGTPLKTGYWKRRIVDSGYNADWKCSECGHKEMTDFPTNYCVNCGCRMLKEGE